MKRKKLILIFVAAALLLIAWPAQGAENVQASLTADRGELTIGDPVQLTLEVAHPAGYQVIIPKLEQSWGEFEVQRQSGTETLPDGDGTETTRQILTVTLFRPGTFETPPLPLTVSDGAGQVTEAVASPVSLTVVPVLAEGDTSLKDIRPQAELVLPASWTAVILGSAAAAAIAGGGFWLYRRKRNHGRAAIDNRTPDQVAFDELDRIDDLELPQRGRFKEHYTLVNDCLRTYIEQQFLVHAFDRTTSELKVSLSQSKMSPEHARLFIDLFSDSDFVKFAKLRPDLREAHLLTAEARTLVDLSKPLPEMGQSGEGINNASDPTKLQPVEAAQ